MILRVGIIGCGVIYQVHYPIIRKNDTVQLISICDIDENRLKEVHNESGCRVYVDYKEMLDKEELDVVHILTPHYLHKEMIIYALEKDIHVLCEKPVVMNLKEAAEVDAVLERSNARLGVVLQNRMNKTSIAMKEYVERKTLGEVIGIRAFINWFRDEEYYTKSDWRGKYETEGGGLLINQSIHTLDLMQWLVGKVAWIEGTYHTRVLKDVIEVEDTAEAMLSYSNGARGLFYATNGYVDNRPVEIELLFEKGSLRLMNNKLYKATADSFEIIAEESSDEVVKNYYGNSHKILIEEFYQALNDNSDEYISFDDGIKVLRLIGAIRRSNDKKIRCYIEGV